MDQLTWNRLTPMERDRQRNLSGLTPALIGLEGWRIEVTYPDNTRSRFIVSRSTGWRPCHIALKRTDSHGGEPVYFPTGTTFRVLYNVNAR